MDLPQNAKIVFKGVRYEVWQWQQELYDGSMATFERIKRADSVNIIAAVRGKVLIQNQEQPSWKESLITLPGGVVDPGEEPLGGAKRELLEETGYVSDDWVLWKEYQFHGIVFTGYIFIARNCRKVVEPDLDAGEKIENKLIPSDEFLLTSENPKFREIEVMIELLRVRLNPEEKEKFRKLLFP